MINLKFTGVGSAFNSRLYNNSCYYREGNKMLLIDCGGDTFRRLQDLCLLNDITDIYVCVTHTHQDHIGSLGTLIAYCSFVTKKKITLILDNDKEYRKQIFDTLLLAGVKKDVDYAVRYTLKNTFAEIYDVDFFNVTHNSFLKSKGYIFYLNTNEKFIYSGDSKNINVILHHCKNTGRFKFVQAYIDCNIDKISKYNDMKPHELLSDLVEAIPPCARKYFTVMHYDSYKCRQKASEYGFNIVYHCTEYEYLNLIDIDNVE